MSNKIKVKGDFIIIDGVKKDTFKNYVKSNKVNL